MNLFPDFAGFYLGNKPRYQIKAQNIEIAIQKFAKNLGEILLLYETNNILGDSKKMARLILGARAFITSDCCLVQKF